MMEDKNDDDVLWRVPVKMTGQGDQLLKDKKEKLLKACAMDIDYVTDSYIIMKIYDDTGKLGGVYKYECKTGKLAKLIREEEEAEVLWGSEYPWMCGGVMFFEGIGKLYSLDPERGQVSSLYAFDESEGIDDYAPTENGCYFFLDVYWTGKDTSSGEKIYYSKDAVYSIPLSDMDQIRYEKKLMDYLDKKGKYGRD